MNSKREVCSAIKIGDEHGLVWNDEYTQQRTVIVNIKVKSKIT